MNSILNHMKKNSLPSLLLLMILGMLFIQCKKTNRTSMEAEKSDTIATAPYIVRDTIPVGVQALLASYPQHVINYKNGKLILVNGDSILYDDCREKSFVEKLDDADPEDMFAFAYYPDSVKPGYLQDAGRSRCELFFKYMYGKTELEVRKHLVPVSWFGESVLFTTVNSASDSLKAVENDLMHLSNINDLRPYLKSSGTFYWRPVRGANRLSAHSYGMTIDIGVALSDYWLWKNPGKSETEKIVYANRVPKEIVDAFERHGFIWGGRWYHFDTMHFEFRPEILYYAIHNMTDNNRYSYDNN